MDESTIGSFGLRYDVDPEHGPDYSNLANWFQYDTQRAASFLSGLSASRWFVHSGVTKR